MGSKVKINHSFILILLVLCISYAISSCNGQLPQSELDSLSFLFTQYGQTLPSDQSICDPQYSLFVICNTTSTLVNDYHVTYIKLNKQYQSNNNPLNTSIVLNFPQLESLTISRIGDTVMNQSINILNMIKDLPLLNLLQIQSDSGIDMIPLSFPIGLPSLRELRIYNCINMKKIDNSFWNSLKTINRLDIKNCPLNDGININQTANFPNLLSFALSVSPTLVSPQIIIQKSSFPLLNSLELYSTGSVKTQLNINSTTLNTVSLDTTNSGFQFIISEYRNLTFLRINGLDTDLVSSVSLSLYPELQTLIIYNTSLTTYPFTTYPPKLTMFAAMYSGFTGFPQSPIPSNFTILNLSNNNLQGTIPVNILPDSTLYLDVQNNPSLGGIVPEKVCTYRVVGFTNTSITQVPDCLYCYYQEGTVYLPSHLLPPPQGFVCNITVNEKFVPSINGELIITGNNLGYGYGITSIQPIIPNKQLRLLTLGYFEGPPYTYSFKLSIIEPNYTKSVETVEAGFMELVPIISLRDQLFSFTIIFNQYNSYLNHTIIVNGTYPCFITSYDTKSITCQLNQTIPQSITNKSSNTFYFNISVANQYYQKSFLSETSNIIVTAIEIDQSNSRNLMLYGNFGTQENIDKSTKSNQVLVNSINFCVINSISPQSINCTLKNQPTNGLATINVRVYTSEFYSSSMLNFGGKSKTYSQLECESLTDNCYNHGQCNSNGICQCFVGYNQADNCLTKYVNISTYEPNPTKPTVKFDIEGNIFEFSIVSLQELDYQDETIIRELLFNDWGVEIITNSTLTTAIYQLRVPASFLKSNNITIEPNITVIISFSTMARDVPFGPKILHINPNSIKVTIKTVNWTYESNLSYLRVVFSTNINTNQTLTYNCETKNVDTISFDDQGSTIEYLRVIKGNIQFNGRFVDYALSDGRQTFSKTQLINQTILPTNSNESLVFIGNILPQCRECVLDPDFTPLIIESQTADGDCPTSSGTSKSWKIAVGVSVGSAIFVTLSIITVYYVAKNRKLKLKFRDAKSIFMKKLGNNV